MFLLSWRFTRTRENRSKKFLTKGTFCRSNAISFLCRVNVLILHQHFNTPYSGGPIRSYYLATALIKSGIQVRVITGSNEKSYRKEIVDGIEVHYLPVEYENRFGFYKRSISFLKFVNGAVKRSKNFKDVDICYAMSVPLTIGIAAMRIKARNKIPFIFEVGDLWPDAPVELGFIRNPILKAVLYALEKKIYRSAKNIVALSPAIKNAINATVPEKTIHLIPNMSDTEFFRPELKDPALVSRFGVENKFVIAYIGAIGIANGLEYLLESAQACQDAKLAVQFIICGDGGERSRVAAQIKNMGLKNVLLEGFKDRDGVKEIMNITDAVFISYRPARILETGSPNKYFDGLAAGKMIIVNFGGWIKDEVENEKIGFYANPLTRTDLAKKLKPVLSSAELLKGYQIAARSLAERKYSRKLLSEKFAKIFE
jgi:glycosyltransferase involved in cell wall biosynthesis